MIVGNARTLAIESKISEAYTGLGTRALGLFVIHVGGNRYGVYESTATLLANSFDEVRDRIAHRGLHTASFAEASDPARIADAFRDAIYRDGPQEAFLDLTREEFSELVYANDLVWAPDGDEAFDDGSYVLQFDVGDRVRLIAFRCGGDGLHDPLTLRDVWISAADYYQVLGQWREAFEKEWAALPKREL
jgi:Immunity protein 42